jgi:thioredoxin reductase (NADPH)
MLLTGEKTLHECEGVFMAIGHQPNTSLFKGVLDTDESGYLIVKPGSTYTKC